MTARRMATVAAAALLCTAYGSSQTTINSIQRPTPGKVLNSNLAGWKADKSDTQFAAQAMEVNMAERELGKLAMQKGSDRVKPIARMMVQDHGEMNRQMQPIAEKIGVAPPAQLSSADQALLASLQNKSGKQFDSAYLQAVLVENRADLTAYNNEERIGKDLTLKNLAAIDSHLAVIHLRAIERIAQPVPAASPPGHGAPAVQPH